MVNWYRHDIPSWMDGTSSLTDKEYRVYHMVIQLIYLHEEPIKLNERVIAGMCNMHVLAARHAIKRLLGLNKLQTDGELVTNRRSTAELLEVGRNRVHAGLGGRAPRKTRNNNGGNGASLHDFGAYKTRLDENRED